MRFLELHGCMERFLRHVKMATAREMRERMMRFLYATSHNSRIDAQHCYSGAEEDALAHLQCMMLNSARCWAEPYRCYFAASCY